MCIRDRKVRDLEKEVKRPLQPQTKAHYGFPADKRGAEVSDSQPEVSVASREAASLIREVQQLKLLYSEKDHTMKQQSERINNLQQQNQILSKKVNELLRQPRVENSSSIQELRSHMCIVPVVYTMSEFTVRRSQSDLTFKPHPFYTYVQGYKLQLIVNAHGDSSGKGTHISIFLSLMKGDFDSQLKWPFRGSVTIQLLNQEANMEHYTECISYHDGTPDQMAGRVMEERRSAKPWGKVKFIAHRDVLPKFVKNDCIKFCVSKVEIL